MSPIILVRHNQVTVHWVAAHGRYTQSPFHFSILIESVAASVTYPLQGKDAIFWWSRDRSTNQFPATCLLQDQVICAEVRVLLVEPPRQVILLLERAWSKSWKFGAIRPTSYNIAITALTGWFPGGTGTGMGGGIAPCQGRSLQV